MLYDRIKELCKERGVSVASIEKAAGLGSGTISKWNTSSPTVENLQAVAKILKVKTSKLLENEEKE